jgi:uncharacterized protein (DUF362 family)
MSARAMVSIVHRPKVPGFPHQYDEGAISFCQQMLRELLAPLGGITAFVKSGQTVLIKPNLVFHYQAEQGYTTDPRIVEALVRLIQEEVPGVGAITLSDGAAAMGIFPITPQMLFDATGMTPIAQRTGVRLAEWEAGERVTIPVQKPLAMAHIDVPKSLLEADVFINLPKLKVHTNGVMTLSIKAMQGIFHRQEKDQHHADDIFTKCLDVIKTVRPHLNIIEGLWAHEGQGPHSPYEGEVIKDMNTLIAGVDPVAVDAVGSAVTGRDPYEVPFVRIGDYYGIGVGKLEQIDVVGASIDSVKRQFRKPSQAIVGVFPNVDVYVHGACICGCNGMVRMALDMVNADGSLDALPRRINVVLGRNAFVPEGLDREFTLVVGDCAEKQKDLGTFYPGCPGVREIFVDFPNAIRVLAGRTV